MAKQPYEIPIDMWECMACAALVGNKDLHDHYCPAKAQTPIGTPIAERNP